MYHCFVYPFGLLAYGLKRQSLYQIEGEQRWMMWQLPNMMLLLINVLRDVINDGVVNICLKSATIECVAELDTIQTQTDKHGASRSKRVRE